MRIIKYLSRLSKIGSAQKIVASTTNSAETSQSMTAVFVGCARDVAPHLSKVLNNIDRLAQLFDRCAYVFVENDSKDSTKVTLKRWLGARKHGHLLEFDGLVKRMPLRTERLAYTRNAYLEHVRRRRYKDYQYLVIVDFDMVNEAGIDTKAFSEALGFLNSSATVHGVFTNSLPLYYDIWALRHPQWCPNDCWAELRESPDLMREQGLDRYIYSRQLFIPSDTPPIPVQSAFGGMAIYSLPSALESHYHGISKDGKEVCEHVSFNLDIAKRGQLYIFPSLHNNAPLEHLGPIASILCNSREIRLEQSGKECYLLAPDVHLLDKYRSNHPLYDRRLPLLAGLMSHATPGKCMIDVGANIGDTIALCRLAGCELDIVAVEPSNQYFAYLEINKRSLPGIFNRVHTVQAFIGSPGEPLALIEDRGTASVKVLEVNAVQDNFEHAVKTMSFDMVTNIPVSIIKTDTDGYDASIIASNMDFIKKNLPVLWLETDTMGNENEVQWQQVLSDLSSMYPYVCIFDNFGFLIAHGKINDKLEMIIDLTGYARRHKAAPKKEVGDPRIYYLDIALFPVQYVNVYREFIDSLLEANK